jgi:MFS transporter, UMF1 family
MSPSDSTVQGGHRPATSRAQIFVWSLFDFANTSFSVLIVAVGFSLYFKGIVVGGSGRGDFFWGLTVSLSMLLTALIAPVLGAASDQGHSRKLYLLGFTLVSVVCTALLYFVGPGMILIGALLFILANIGFEGGIVFYDAFLPLLATREKLGRISGYGFAMGYVGSLTSLMIAMPLYAQGFVPENLPNVRFSFVIAAGMFLLFSLPLFIFLKDASPVSVRGGSYLRAGFRRVRETISHLQSYKQVGLFLIAFFLYNDGILTVISFASIFAEESLSFTLREILILFAIVQASAIGGSLLFGWMTDRIGPKHSIIISLICWIGVVIGAYFVASKLMFYGIGIVAGACMGGSQSASRSLMAMLTPAEREAEFFGFYDGFCGKASAVIGTFVFGALSWATGSQRIAALSVGLFFLAGLALLYFVNDPSQHSRQPTLPRN